MLYGHKADACHVLASVALVTLTIHPSTAHNTVFHPPLLHIIHTCHRPSSLGAIVTHRCHHSTCTPEAYRVLCRDEHSNSCCHHLRQASVSACPKYVGSHDALTPCSAPRMPCRQSIFNPTCLCLGTRARCRNHRCTRDVRWYLKLPA